MADFVFLGGLCGRISPTGFWVAAADGLFMGIDGHRPPLQDFSRITHDQSPIFPLPTLGGKWADHGGISPARIWVAAADGRGILPNQKIDNRQSSIVNRQSSGFAWGWPRTPCQMPGSGYP
jgi:hypothetical protein